MVQTPFNIILNNLCTLTIELEVCCSMALQHAISNTPLNPPTSLVLHAPASDPTVLTSPCASRYSVKLGHTRLPRITTSCVVRAMMNNAVPPFSARIQRGEGIAPVKHSALACCAHT